MASGLLTGAMTRERIAALPADDWRRKNPDFQEPLLSRNLRLVRLLRGHRQAARPVAGRGGRRLGAATSGRDRRHRGARRPGQFKGVVGAAEFRLSPREVAEIEAFFRLEARRPEAGPPPEFGAPSPSGHHAATGH